MATNAADAINTTFYIKLPKPKLPTTQDMVNEALEALYTVRGVSLYKIKKFMEERYCFILNGPRKARIKNYMHELLQSGALVNVTGKGLVGSVRLNRQQKSQKPPNQQQPKKRQPRFKVALMAETTTKRKQPRKKQTQQLKTPPNKSTSMQARRALQNAPIVMVQHANPTALHGMNSIDIDGTPRSSGGAVRKRNLHTAIPPNPSQIFEASSISESNDTDGTVDLDDLSLSPPANKRINC